ncbi:hypothetical protein [Paenibacillus campi]|uniref:hypothetical protein n=1 Tax=Paenibacillus campi TaxID=3106031 RepID=UPI002B003065|nr:hypothetical protein [Paenibacillus sp. SGZ-1009]
MKMERLINLLNVSDQLELHGELSFQALKVIKDYRHQLAISDAVKEHVIWCYFSKQSWSDAMLEEVGTIYQETSFMAMESIVLIALKQNKVTEQQVAYIQNVFSTKEVWKQIKRWQERQQAGE